METKDYNDFENIEGYINYLKTQEILSTYDHNSIDCAIFYIEASGEVEEEEGIKLIEILREIQDRCLQ